MSKIKISFVVSETLQSEFRQKLVQEGYGLRGKSLWIFEAIESLLAINNFPELVSISNTMQGFNKSETIIGDASLKIKLDKAALTIRKVYPTLEGVQSSIIRTAIIQRLLRS